MIKFIADQLTKKVEKEVIDLLIKSMGTYYPERSHQIVHASDVTKENFCPRQYALMDHLEVKRPERFISPALKATFDVGKATADLVVNDWLGAHAIGHWQCSVCRDTRYFQRKPDPQIQNGHRCVWRYREVEFFDPQSEISGSMDLLIDLGIGKATIVEIKIMGVDEFADLVAPLGEHRARTRLYLRLVAESTSIYKQWVDIDRAKILYISRGFGKKNAGVIHPFKEFTVERDDPSVQVYMDRGMAVAQARKTKVIPVARVCDSVGCWTAKSCPVKQECWSGSY